MVPSLQRSCVKYPNKDDLQTHMLNSTHENARDSKVGFNLSSAPPSRLFLRTIYDRRTLGFCRSKREPYDICALLPQHRSQMLP